MSVKSQTKPTTAPQSNQRGIETTALDRKNRDKLMPQSNQRGIETKRREGKREADRRPQSNQRGIETGQNFSKRVARGAPQSNQRGIETASLQHRGRSNQRSLNRTSVGLKRMWGLNVIPGNVRASIEPAWD